LMMKFFSHFAKALMIIIWGLFIANLFFRVTGKAALAIYFLLDFVVAMHDIQLLVNYAAFAEKLKITKKEGFPIIYFRV
ncbi:DUF1145 domain-containing protein, partial [Psychromonas arctica]